MSTSPCNITTVLDANTVALVRTNSGCVMYVLGFTVDEADSLTFKQECRDWADSLSAM